MPELIVRIELGDAVRLGPGKAMLLEKIGELGSISAAARAMNMSYKRAWQLIEEMNDVFAEPVVTSHAGGQKGGGAEITAMGRSVIKSYAGIVAAAARHGASHLARLDTMLKKAKP